MASGAALLVVCVFVGGAVAGASAPPAVPTAAQLAWSSLERGCLIHFNMCAVSRTSRSLLMDCAILSS